MHPWSRLYIIGNGFDRYHNIPSDYRDFGNYLKKADPEIFSEVETYFCVDDHFWWKFEAELANFNADTAIENASDLLVSYAAEDWSDSYHHDYQCELKRIVDAISVSMRGHFADWVRQLPIPAMGALAGKPLPLDKNARYLNFNYTQTLQQTYGIPSAQILHIHGNASNPSDQIVLGHGWHRNSSDSRNHGIELSEADTREIEGNQIVDDYFSKTFKPTDQIIEQQQSFFSSLNSIRQILVMGHSLSEVDAPYLKEIIRNIDSSAVTWKVSYHSDPTDSQNNLSALGVDISLATFSRLNDVDAWKY